MSTVLLYLKAIRSNHPQEEEEEAFVRVPEIVDFGAAYANRIAACHDEPTKQKLLIGNLKDTLRRLVAVAPHSSATTRWVGENTLVFAPRHVDPPLISEEQRASFLIMYKWPDSRRIKIVIDLVGVTISSATRLSTQATFDQIKDGMRLWSCLPHPVGEIVVVCDPKDHKVRLLCNRLLPVFLTSKLRSKVCVIHDMKDAVEE
jgi:hypothetical protein